MAEIKLTELDFVGNRENLKNFLRSQDKFQDFDFDGANISVLLDLLSYNTTYLAYYLSMVVNESFMSSAIKRASVVSRAKEIGYVPRSRKSSRAVVTLQLFPGDSPTSITIPKGTQFNTSVDGKQYTFSTREVYIVPRSTNGSYILRDVTIVEGEPLFMRYTVGTDPVGKFYPIPNSGVDTDELIVKIQVSSSDSRLSVFKRYDDFNTLNPDSAVYFLQENFEEKTEIYFGDGVIGKALTPGNIIIIDYLISSGSAPNGANAFSLVERIAGYTGTKITVTSSASGGSEEESIDSIKFSAPLHYEAQNREITKNDYESIILRDYPSAQSVRVWGGEENDPPQYGRVFVSIKPKDGLVISEASKSYLVNTIISKRNTVGFETIIVDPEYIHLLVNSTIKYKSVTTSDSAAQIANTVISAIKEFADLELNQFQNSFRYSKFVKAIDSSHPAILNNLTSVRLRYRLFPSFLTASKYIVNFSNALESSFTSIGKATLQSSKFILNGSECYFTDDGDGKVVVYKFVDNIATTIIENAGTIEYSTGRIVFNAFLPSVFPDGVTDYIDLYVRPSNFDISSVRNQILLIEDDDISVSVLDESITTR